VVRDAAVCFIAIKAADDGYRHIAQQNDPSRCGIDARLRCQLQGPDLATSDATRVAHAGELADGESAVLIHQRALGPHATQRRALALQITQILGGLIAASTARLAWKTRASSTRGGVLRRPATVGRCQVPSGSRKRNAPTRLKSSTASR
jgi:hypothetical protein